MTDIYRLRGSTTGRRHCDDVDGTLAELSFSVFTGSCPSFSDPLSSLHRDGLETKSKFQSRA